MNLHIHIKDISYKHKGYFKIQCIIHWINPLSGNIQKSVGVARLHPNDMAKANATTGERIAEGRAKIKMWQDFQVCLITIKADMMVKYDHLVNHEINHVNNLINNN